MNAKSPVHTILPELTMGKSKQWTREDVAQRILAGQNVVIFRNSVLLIPTSWLDAHPGGALTILHFVGRDATDEIEAYHFGKSLDLIKKYAVGTIDIGESGWEPLLPPVMSGWVRKLGKDGAAAWHNEASPLYPTEHTELSPSSQILLVEKTQDDDEEGAASTGPSMQHLVPPPTPYSLKTQRTHSTAYRALHQRITDAGLYQTPWFTGVLPEVLRFTSFGVVSAIAYKYNWLITSAVFLGMLWHQLVFFCHDLGHMGVTHDWFWDRLIAISLADFVGGLSIGWWVEVRTFPSPPYPTFDLTTSYPSLHRATTCITVSHHHPPHLNSTLLTCLSIRSGHESPHPVS